MAVFSHYPLQNSLYQLLANDTALDAMINGIYDTPPENTAFPYVTFGEFQGADWSTKTTSGMEQNIALHIWSREGGRKQAALIMERLHTLLHQSNPSVAGQTVVLMRFLSSNLVLENDGWTYHGIMQFHVLLEAA